MFHFQNGKHLICIDKEKEDKNLIIHLNICIESIEK